MTPNKRFILGQHFVELAMMFGISFLLSKLKGDLTYLNLLTICQAALLSCVALASCLFSLYRTFDADAKQNEIRRRVRVTGRRFIAGAASSIIGLAISGGVFLSNAPEPTPVVPGALAGLMACIFGILTTYIVLGLYGLGIVAGRMRNLDGFY
jgi:hypothetical protein